MLIISTWNDKEIRTPDVIKASRKAGAYFDMPERDFHPSRLLDWASIVVERAAEVDIEVWTLDGTVFNALRVEIMMQHYEQAYLRVYNGAVFNSLWIDLDGRLEYWPESPFNVYGEILDYLLGGYIK